MTWNENDRKEEERLGSQMMKSTPLAIFQDVDEMEMEKKVIKELYEMQVVFNFHFEKSYGHIPGKSNGNSLRRLGDS